MRGIKACNIFTTSNKLDIAFDLVNSLICYASPKHTHGPVIKTGPTAGQNRSRNKNGRWRKKRSDAGTTRK